MNYQIHPHFLDAPTRERAYPFFMHPDSECFYCPAVSLFLPLWLVDVTFFLNTFSWMPFWTSGVVLEYCMRIAGRHRVHSSHPLLLFPMALLGRGMCSVKSEMNTLLTRLKSVCLLCQFSCAPSFIFVLPHAPLRHLPVRASPLDLCVCMCVHERVFVLLFVLLF